MIIFQGIKFRQLFISLTLLITFLLSVDYVRTDFRWHLYGKYTDNSAHTLTSAKIWYDEGPINVKFASILSHKSIQYKNHDSNVHTRHIGRLTYPTKIGEHLREVYISYPTGYIMPLYILSIIRGQPPTDKDVYSLNKFLSLVLFATLFLILITLTNRSYLFAASVAISSFISIGFIYFYQIFLSYNSLGVIYFSLFLYLRLLGKKPLSCLVLLIGLLTDYLFFFVVIYQIIANFIKEKKISADTALIVVISVFSGVLFFYQLYSLNLLDNILWKAQFRLGLVDAVSSGGEQVSDISNMNIFKFVLFYGFNTFKVVGPMIIAFPVFFVLLIMKSTKKEINFILLATIPPVLYTFALRTSSMHEYEVLKFIPAATIIFGLTAKLFWNKRYILVSVIFLVNLLNTYYFLPEYKLTEKFYTQSNFKDSQQRHDYNLFIRDNTTHNDLIFSIEDDVEIWNGRLVFNLAPYMWWRDYPYRQRNLNRAVNLNSVLMRIKEFNVQAEKFLIIIPLKEKNSDLRLKSLDVVAETAYHQILDIKPLLTNF
ncbi:hypothetical protein OAO40_00255 [Amylibacter sp.]|nr:hypothetical protein [Amylibacter sp.]